MIAGTVLLMVVVPCVGSSTSPRRASNTLQERRYAPYEGTYFLGGGGTNEPEMTLVIRRDGKPMPPDPRDERPAVRGLYVGARHFAFAHFELRRGQVMFSTASLDGIRYVFRGKLGVRKEPDFGQVPYVTGTLTSYRRGRVLAERTVLFGHAVNA